VTSKTLVSGGCVLALGTKTPNLRQADVLIEDGLVAEVGSGLRSRDAERVDAADTIVMPGFVDAHRHVWRSLFRNDGDAEGVVDAARPDDVYAATLIGLLGAAEAGITTVVDWSPAVPDDGVIEAALQAHVDAGLRTVFVHADREAAERAAAKTGPLTSVAHGSVGTDPETVATEWGRARERGLRIHAHGASGPGSVAALGRRGLLGEDVTLVHCPDLDEADLEAIASSGAGLALAPTSEMANGLGTPPIQQLIDADIRPGLGVDDDRLTPGDMFAQMRAVISLQHATVFHRKLAGKAGVPKLMTTRDAIRFATVDGARVAGLRGVTGALEPGMQADVIVLRTDRPNVFPVNDPIGAVVWGMDTSNIDHVYVQGRAVMRGGVLEADVERARRLAITARDRMASTAGAVGAAHEGAS
jgi:5-methylthioadenosine/S-adenosylhomocysteine deaminase